MFTLGITNKTKIMTKQIIDYYFPIYQNIANICFEKFQLISWHSLLRPETIHILNERLTKINMAMLIKLCQKRIMFKIFAIFQ